MSGTRHWAQPIVISGMGVITPYGRGVDVFATALREGRSAIESVTLPPFEEPRPAGLLPKQTLEQWLEPIAESDAALAKRMKKLLKRKPIAAVLSALVAAQAWESAGLGEGYTEGTGVVVGGHSLSSAYEFELRKKFDISPNHLSPSFAVNLLDTDHVGVVSALLNLHGQGMTVGGASASGQMAIIQAANLIRLGDLERCVVVGPMADLSPMVIQSFDALGALGGHDFADNPAEACKPFDKNRNGFIFAQASGALVLESIASAKSRSHEPLGYLQGAGVYLDATAMPSPSAEGEAAAMRLALEASGVGSESVDTINAHGTASGAGDVAELEAIKQIFGERAESLCVQSTKGLLGHTLWAAGLVETIGLVSQMQGNFTHPNLNLSDPIRTDIGLAPGTTTPRGPEIAISNSFGFGGINTSIVVSKSRERNSP